MARAKRQNSDQKPETKVAAIRQAVTALGGLDRADTPQVAEYVNKTWGMNIKTAEVSQWKSNERRRLREREQATPAPVAAHPDAPPAPAANEKSGEAMSLDDIDQLARLVNRYGVGTVRRVLTAFYGG